jgi:hypothetical protein
VRAPDLLRPCLSRLSCLSSVSSLSPLAILLRICTYLHVKSRTVNDSFPGDVLDTAVPSACRRAVEVAMESRASRQVDAASRGPDNLHSRNDKKAFFSIHAESGLSSVLDPSFTDKKQPDHYYYHLPRDTCSSLDHKVSCNNLHQAPSPSPSKHRVGVGAHSSRWIDGRRFAVQSHTG